MKRYYDHNLESNMIENF